MNAAGLASVDTGAVTGVHRAGVSPNVHAHLLCLDGVDVDDGEETLRFEPASASIRLFPAQKKRPARRSAGRTALDRGPS